MKILFSTTEKQNETGKSAIKLLMNIFLTKQSSHFYSSQIQQAKYVEILLLKKKTQSSIKR